MENKLCSERFNSLKEKMEKGYGTSRSFNAEDIEDGVTWDVQSGNQKFIDNELNSIDNLFTNNNQLEKFIKYLGRMSNQKFGSNNFIVENAEEQVNHPSRYNRSSSVECIEEMIAVFGKEAVRDFCICNVWKYRYRALDKGGQQDMEKSDWYMNKFLELSE